MTNPTFEQAVDYLKLEERRLKGVRARAVHSALAAGIAPAPVPATPIHQQGGGGGGRNRRRGRGGGRTNGGNIGGGPHPGYPQPTPPWSGGHNPWTGVVHTYTMPVPRPPPRHPWSAPAPGLLRLPTDGPERAALRPRLRWHAALRLPSRPAGTLGSCSLHRSSVRAPAGRLQR
jgi:hypothetical protein